MCVDSVAVGQQPMDEARRCAYAGCVKELTSRRHSRA